MAQVIEQDASLDELRAALERQLPGAQVVSERITGLDVNYLRLIVMADQFRTMEFDDRHKFVWELAKTTLPERDSSRLLSVIPLTTEEARGEE